MIISDDHDVHLSTLTRVVSDRSGKLAGMWVYPLHRARTRVPQQRRRVEVREERSASTILIRGESSILTRRVWQGKRQDEGPCHKISHTCHRAIDSRGKIAQVGRKTPPIDRHAARMTHLSPGWLHGRLQEFMAEFGFKWFFRFFGQKSFSVCFAQAGHHTV